MSATPKNNPTTASTLSGKEIFEQALTLSTQGIDLLLKNLFEQLANTKLYHLSAKDSKRLIAQVKRKQELIFSSYLFQIKNNFSDFKALRKNRLHQSTSTNHQVLGLVGTNEYTEAEELKSMISRFEKKYDKYYLSIAERLGSCINRAQVEPLDNPMHVKHLCQSFQHSISTLSLVMAQKIALYKLFADIVIDRLEPLYKSLEQCFIENDISPDIETMPDKPPIQESSLQSASNSSSVAMTHIPVLMAVFQNFKDKSNKPNNAYTNLFSELKQSLEQHEINDFNSLIDQLSAIFELVFADEDLAERIKEQIARLQIFIFMSEIQQGGFPTHSSHPARRLIDTIIKTEVDFGLNGLSNQSGYDFLHEAIDKISNNPFIDSHTYAALLEQYIEQTSAESTSKAEVDVNPELIKEVAAEPNLESELAPQQEIIEEIELSGEDTVVSSKKVESIHAVIQSIVYDISLPLRIQGRSLILFDEVWSPLLLEVATTEGFKSTAWQKLMTIAKTQVWVLTPQTRQAELEKLVSMLAHVEKSLTQSMQSLSISVDQQASLLEFLKHEQADVIAQSKAYIDETSAAEQSQEEPVAEMPETNLASSNPKNDQLADTIDEFSNLMETGRFNRSNDMLKALQSDKATAESKVPVDAGMIHKSDWVEIKKGATTVLAKLTWKAEDMSHFIFVDREGNRVCEISKEDLNKELKDGNISPITSTRVNAQRAAFSVIQTIN